MQHQFTPAADRVLQFTASYASRDDYADLAYPALLLGLLAESECQAALMLAERGISEQSVRQRWPKLMEPPSAGGLYTTAQSALPPNLNHSIQLVADLVAEFDNPPILGTEHLLLSLLITKKEIATWLTGQGILAEQVQTDIHKRHGYQAGPLPIDTESGQWSVDSGQCETASASDKNSSFILHPSSFAPLRIIDAAANRAREGLRVAEDFVRFTLDDRHLTELCKQLRHDLAALLSQIPGEQLLAARETQADVGTSLTSPSEAHRADMTEVLVANFARLQESLRSLEEFGKLIDPTWAAEIKKLRYRSYTLHRAFEITRTSVRRLSNARLYVLIDGRAALDDFRQLAQSLITAGVHIIQLRDKNLDDRQLLERGRLLCEMTRGDCPNFRVNENGTVPFATQGAKTLFIMNDRPDLAAICLADGVHLGQEDVSVKDARAIVGPDALIGVSTHSIDQARQAVLDGANYIGVGPTFTSGTKKFEKFPGLDLLRAVAAEIRLPAFAIGGITPANLPEALSTGITRIALSGAITSAPDPAVVVRRLLEQLMRIEH
jgi:thiamine-phosphate pyrophosphorylase